MKYGVILADPPWQYDIAGRLGAAENHYATMSIDAICALPVAQLAAPDSVLLLWGTWPKLPEGLRVVEAWGFHFVTGFPWVKVTDVSHDLWGNLTFKPHYGTGYWARGASEFVLIGKRGDISPPSGQFVGLLSPNMRHSRKPESLHHYAMSLPGPYLELFARRPFPGWDVWGNEVKSTVEVHR